MVIRTMWRLTSACVIVGLFSAGCSSSGGGSSGGATDSLGAFGQRFELSTEVSGWTAVTSPAYATYTASGYTTAVDGAAAQYMNGGVLYVAMQTMSGANQHN